MPATFSRAVAIPATLLRSFWVGGRLSEDATQRRGQSGSRRQTSRHDTMLHLRTPKSFKPKTNTNTLVFEHMTLYRLVYGYQHSGGHIRDPTAPYTACPRNDYSAFQLSTNVIRSVRSLLYKVSKKSLCNCWKSDIDYSCRHSIYSSCCKYPHEHVKVTYLMCGTYHFQHRATPFWHSCT